MTAIETLIAMKVIPANPTPQFRANIKLIVKISKEMVTIMEENKAKLKLS